MIIIRLLIIAALLTSYMICMAQNVDEETARNRGINFLSAKMTSLNRVPNRVPTQALYDLSYTATKNGKICYYVYNCSKGGYVIVSADERSISPILGYSTDGYFDYDKLGDNARWWINNLTNSICALDTLPNISSGKSRKVLTEEIKPLLGNLAWNQWSPYNILCPEINGGNYPTGCVVTAAAQIMYYHQWPERGNGIVSNGWDNYLTKIDLSESIYRWDLMQPTYDDLSSLESQVSVATLMRDLGYAVDAVYCLDGTGADASTCALKLIENFDYSPAITIFYRKYYYDQEWDDIVYSELDNHRPCLYSGYGEHGGHTFVCDGYDKEGYFHFNFGWGGMGNGYFLSTAVNGYDNDQSVVTGIMKNNGEDPVISFCATDLFYNENSPNEETSIISVSDMYINALGVNVQDDDYYIGLFFQNNNSGEVIYPFDNSLGSTSMPLTDKRMSATASFLLKNGCLPDGDYSIFLGVGSKIKNRWQKAHFPNNDDYYISMKISDGYLAFENHNSIDCEDGKVYINGIYYTLDENNNTARVTNKNSYSHYYHDDIIIPNTIIVDEKQYDVNGISEYAFFKCDHLSSVFIPKNVEFIEKNAFPSSSVKSVLFEQDSKLKIIGEGAFYACSQLDNIILPNGLISIGDGAFNSCLKLKSINIPESVETIGRKAFSLDSGNFKDVSVYWKEPKVFDDAFVWGDFNVTLHVPEGTSLLYGSLRCWSNFDIVEGDWTEKILIDNLWYHLLPNKNIAFVSSPDNGEKYSEKEMHIPSEIEFEDHKFSVVQVEQECFKGAELKTIFLPSTIEIIGEYAFHESMVEEVIFEEKSQLSEIQESAFLFSSLKKIELPVNLKTIKQNAFALTNLNTIEIPASVQEIGFNPVSSRANTLSSIVVNWVAPIDFGNIFPDDVANINLYVPEGTALRYGKTISWSGFSIIEGKYEEFIITENGLRYLLESPKMTATVITPKEGEDPYKGDEIVIPSVIKYNDKEFDVTEIGSSAFEQSQINSVSLPNTLKKIGFRGFCGSQLKKIEIESNSALSDIERFAFGYCSNLDNFPLCENLQKIYLGAFVYCSSLSEFFIPKSINFIESYSFDSSLKDVYVYWADPKEFDPSVFASPENATLHIPLSSKEKYEIAEPWHRFGNIIEDEILGDGVFVLTYDDALCDIYSPAGILVRKEVRSSEIDNLPPGLYLIHQQGKTTKLLK